MRVVGAPAHDPLRRDPFRFAPHPDRHVVAHATGEARASRRAREGAARCPRPRRGAPAPRRPTLRRPSSRRPLRDPHRRTPAHPLETDAQRSHPRIPMPAGSRPHCRAGARAHNRRRQERAPRGRRRASKRIPRSQAPPPVDSAEPPGRWSRRFQGGGRYETNQRSRAWRHVRPTHIVGSRTESECKISDSPATEVTTTQEATEVARTGRER